MHLRRLEITNFRNYCRQYLEPCFSLNIISGDNAQGKTNILESIYLSCTGRSFRAMKNSEMINWDSDFSLINGLFETAERELELKLLLTKGHKKIKVNGILTRGYPLRWPGVVLFTPEDLSAVKGSPQERRHLLDTEIGPLDNQYNYYNNRYQRVLQQRNNLLREIRDKKQDRESLSAWNEQLNQYGSIIIHMRLSLLKKINPIIKSIYHELTGGLEEISLRYGSSLTIDPAQNEQEISSRFSHAIAVAEREETARGQSLIGPHRDDLIFLINGKEARLYGSQGQQRSLILSLKLTLIQIWYNEIGEYPILLLDDVLSELDDKRQKALLKKISNNVQTFITSSIFEDMDTGVELIKRNFVVRSGKIIN